MIGVVPAPEPNFQPPDPSHRRVNEKELQNAIAFAIRGAFDNARTVVITGFGLDVAIFTENTDRVARTCFIEAKVATIESGRINIGPQFSKTYQPDLGNQIALFFERGTRTLRSQSQIELLDRCVRWVVADLSQPINSRRFVFFSCIEAPQVAANAKFALTKQNNFSLPLIRSRLEWITWIEVLERIEDFIIHG
jgi:hypothetical protein